MGQENTTLAPQGAMDAAVEEFRAYQRLQAGEEARRSRKANGGFWPTNYITDDLEGSIAALREEFQTFGNTTKFKSYEQLAKQWLEKKQQENTATSKNGGGYGPTHAKEYLLNTALGNPRLSAVVYSIKGADGTRCYGDTAKVATAQPGEKLVLDNDGLRMADGATILPVRMDFRALVAGDGRVDYSQNLPRVDKIPLKTNNKPYGGSSINLLSAPGTTVDMRKHHGSLDGYTSISAQDNANFIFGEKSRYVLIHLNEERFSPDSEQKQAVFSLPVSLAKTLEVKRSNDPSDYQVILEQDASKLYVYLKSKGFGNEYTQPLNAVLRIERKDGRHVDVELMKDGIGAGKDAAEIKQRISAAIGELEKLPPLQGALPQLQR